jgi:hypothetical protein
VRRVAYIQRFDRERLIRLVQHCCLHGAASC